MTEQDKFEAWLTSGIKGKPFPKNEDGNYLHMHWQIQWLAWQAAIASREPMTEVEAMQIVSNRPYGTLVNLLHYAIRETELFHGIEK